MAFALILLAMSSELHIAVSDLRSAVRNGPNGFFTHIISTIETKANLSALQLAHEAGNIKHFVVHFEDEEDDSQPTNKIVPKLEHIQHILAFSKDLTPDDHILVHCVGGISRSTATAIGIHCQHGSTPEEAIAQVKKVRPQMFPNLTITKHFDTALGLNGRLLSAVQDFLNKLAAKSKLIGLTQ